MDYEILKTYEEVSNYVDRITSIADEHKNEFGFLAQSAFEGLAGKNQLWAAVDSSGELQGYLMFGGVMPTLKVFQIYSSSSVKGLGRHLLEELKQFAEQNYYHSISARVATDLKANIFWERNGFKVYQQVKGGKTTGRTINVRRYAIERNDLFGGFAPESSKVKPSAPLLQSPIYALDLNLLMSVLKNQEGTKQVIALLNQGLQGLCQICITPEFKKELERNSRYFEDDPALHIAAALPELESSQDVEGLAETIRQIVFPGKPKTSKSYENDISDARHLAYAVLADIDAFVTRDKAQLRASIKMKDQYGLSILSLDELVSDDGHNIDFGLASSLEFSCSQVSVTSEVREFLQACGASKDYVEREFGSVVSATVYEARSEGVLFGVYFQQKPVKARGRSKAALFIDETNNKTLAAIDHFLETALRIKCDYFFVIDLTIGKGQPITENTLKKKGFIDTGENYVKVICNDFLDKDNWSEFVKDLNSACGLKAPQKMPKPNELRCSGIRLMDLGKRSEMFSLFDFETLIGPRFTVDAGRDCVLIPIKEQYANGLIGNVYKKLSLLPDTEPTLLLEKAYFRSTSKARYFSRGSLVAFYVSGNKSIQEIIGFARITYTDVLSVEEAVAKLSRQGVLSRSELNTMVDKEGKLHAFTFDNFLEFDNRITFSKAKQLGLISNANLVAPELLNADQLKVLIGEVF